MKISHKNVDISFDETAKEPTPITYSSDEPLALIELKSSLEFAGGMRGNAINLEQEYPADFIFAFNQTFGTDITALDLYVPTVPEGAQY